MRSAGGGGVDGHGPGGGAMLVVLLQDAMPTAQNLVVLLHLDGKERSPRQQPGSAGLYVDRMEHKTSRCTARVYAA